MFNPLSGEIPQNIADDMDNKLYVGAELKQVSYLVDISFYCNMQRITLILSCVEQNIGSVCFASLPNTGMLLIQQNALTVPLHSAAEQLETT